MTPDRSVPTGLVGLFLHTWSEDGVLEYQGHIVGLDGDVVLVELFSWLDGCPTVVKPFAKEYVLSARVTLYVDAEMMHEGWQKNCRRLQAKGDPSMQNWEYESYRDYKKTWG